MKQKIIIIVMLSVIFNACNNSSQDNVDVNMTENEEPDRSILEPTKLEVLDGWTFPELSFDYNGLEPFMDKQTVYLHYEKHHKGYYNRLIKAIRGTDLASLQLEDLLMNSKQYDAKIISNAGQHFNHKLFWEVLSPVKTELDENSSLGKAIISDFGSLENFKSEFSDVAKTKFGSGWAWLSIDNSGKLFVSATSNHINPLMDIVKKRGMPVLGIDVWEHAYYLKYQNRRQEYIDSFWEIINWPKVEEKFNEAIEE